MANDTISQIKINNTIYNFCDYETRSNLTKWKTISRKVSSYFSIPAEDFTSFAWQGSIGEAYTYWGYVSYSIGARSSVYNPYVYAVILTEDGMVLSNMATADVSVNPKAVMLCSENYLSYS